MQAGKGVQETALSSHSCHNPWTSSRTLGRKHLLTTGHSLSSRRASRAAPRAARGASLPQGLCTGATGGQKSPQCYPAGERQAPPVSISAPSPTSSETPHAECALPLKAIWPIHVRLVPVLALHRMIMAPPLPLLKRSGVPTVFPHSWSA